jgi:hypothetical protein
VVEISRKQSDRSCYAFRVCVASFLVSPNRQDGFGLQVNRGVVILVEGVTHDLKDDKVTIGHAKKIIFIRVLYLATAQRGGK